MAKEKIFCLKGSVLHSCPMTKLLAGCTLYTGTIDK